MNRTKIKQERKFLKIEEIFKNKINFTFNNNELLDFFRIIHDSLI